MQPRTLVLSCVAQAVTAAVALYVLHGLKIGNLSLGFMLAAIVGSQVAAVLQAKDPAGTNTAGAKLYLGMALAATALVVGGAVQLAFSLFAYPEVTLPIATIGTMVFPFAVYGTIFQGQRKAAVKQDS